MDISANGAIDLIIVLTRAIVLIISAMGGVLSIYLGWKLYRDELISPVNAELEQGTRWKLRISALGPGVFFAIFGMGILIYLVRQDVQMQDTTPVFQNTAYAPSELSAAGRSIRSIAFEPRAPVAAFPVVIVANKPYRCVLAMRNRRFDSGVGITPAEVEKTLAETLALLGKIDVKSLSPTELKQLEHARHMLDTLEKGDEAEQDAL